MKSVKQNLAERIERYRHFHQDAERGLMACVGVARAAKSDDKPRPLVVPLAALNWQDEDSLRKFAASHVESLRHGLAQREHLDDDGIPSIQNLAGTGTIAASVVRDAVVRYERDTNYLEQPIRNWAEDMERIAFDPENIFYRGYMVMLRTLIDKWDGDFGISGFTFFDPLDLVNQFRGNDLFLDFTDAPEHVHALLARCREAICALRQHMHAHYLQGYTFPGLCIGGCWCPGGEYLSCDAGDLINPETLRAFGLPYTAAIVRAWGGSFLHHHELGIHQIESWTGVVGLSIQFLNRDPNTAHLANMIDDDIIAFSRRVPICFIATGAEFIARAVNWNRGKFVVNVSCDTLDEAREVVRLTQRLREEEWS